MLTLDLVSVNVGMPAPLGVWQGDAIVSGIRKTPIGAASIATSAVNLDGDGQADLTVHGGEDKAIYAYPSDNWPWWQANANFAAGPASFGENLTTRGGDEAVVRIGDVFRWEAITLEVSQPRAPCFKFSMLTGREDLGSRMVVSGRTGWYFRVLETGRAATMGKLERVATHDESPTVREAFAALFHPRVASDIVERTLNAPALARTWRAGLARRLRAASS